MYHIAMPSISSGIQPSTGLYMVFLSFKMLILYTISNDEVSTGYSINMIWVRDEDRIELTWLIKRPPYLFSTFGISLMTSLRATVVPIFKNSRGYSNF